MPSVTPNTTIRLIKGCPLTADQQHTIFFVRRQDQEAYFSRLADRTGLTFERQSYQRVGANRLKIQVDTDVVYDVDYLMFRNEGHTSKWFYAFVTAVNYIGERCTEIEYEIDVLQTWHFQYNSNQCFVERETPIEDELYGNLVPEDLDLGDSYIVAATKEYDMSEMNVCVAATELPVGLTPSWVSTSTPSINGLATPLYFFAGMPANHTNKNNGVFLYGKEGMYRFPVSGTNSEFTDFDYLMAAYIKDNKIDSVVGVWQYPNKGPFVVGSNQAVTEDVVELTPPKTFGGYTPRCKKLYTYPYSYLSVSNNSGTVSDYRWENWYVGGSTDADKVPYKFNVAITPIGSPCALAYPMMHRGVMKDYDYGIVYSAFPQIPWLSDAYQAYCAQNKSQVVASAGSQMVGSAVGGAAVASAVAPKLIGAAVTAALGATVPIAGLAVGAGIAAFGAITDALAKKADLERVPPQVNGQSLCDSLNVAMRKVKFSFRSTTVKDYAARTIDDYFWMYGYATKRVKIPNRKVRENWTYVKTVGYSLTGNLPAEDERKICDIYDRGVTFWTSGDAIGNYGLPNRTPSQQAVGQSDEEMVIDGSR